MPVVTPLDKDQEQQDQSGAPTPVSLGFSAGATAPPPAAPGPSQNGQQPPEQSIQAAEQQAGQYAGGSMVHGPSTAAELPPRQEPKLPVEAKQPPARGVWATQTEQPQAQPDQTVWGTQASQQIQQETTEATAGQKQAEQQSQQAMQAIQQGDPVVDQNTGDPVVGDSHQDHLSKLSTDDIYKLFTNNQINDVAQATDAFKVAQQREMNNAHLDWNKVSQDFVTDFAGIASGIGHDMRSPVHDFKKGVGDMWNKLGTFGNSWADAFGGSGATELQQHEDQLLKSGQIDQGEFDRRKGLINQANQINDVLGTGIYDYSNEQSDIDKLTSAKLKRAQLLQDADPDWAQHRGQQALHEAFMGSNLSGEQFKSYLQNNLGDQATSKFLQYWGGKYSDLKSDQDISDFLSRGKQQATNLQRTAAGVPDVTQQKGLETLSAIQGKPLQTIDELSQAGFAPDKQKIADIAEGQNMIGQTALSLAVDPALGELFNPLTNLALRGAATVPRMVAGAAEKASAFEKKNWALTLLSHGIGFAVDAAHKGLPEAFSNFGERVLTTVGGVGEHWAIGQGGKLLNFAGRLGGDMLQDAATESYNGRGLMYQLAARSARSGVEAVPGSAIYAGLTSNDPKSFGEQFGNMWGLHMLAHGPSNTLKALQGDIGDSLYVGRGDKPNSPVNDFAYGHDPHMDAVSRAEATNHLDPSQYGLYTRVKDLMRSFVNIYVLPTAELHAEMQRRGLTQFQGAKGFAVPADRSAIPGRGEIFVDSAHFNDAFLHEAVGHPAYWMLDPKGRAQITDLIKRQNDPVKFTNRYLEKTPYQGTSYNDLPTAADINAGKAPHWSGLTKDSMDAEMAAEQFGAFFRGKTVDQWTKSPTIRRAIGMRIGSVMEKMGIPATTREAGTVLGVRPSVTAALQFDKWLRDMAGQRGGPQVSTGTMPGYQGPGGAGAPPTGGVPPTGTVPPVGGAPPPTGTTPPPAPGAPPYPIKPANVISVRTVGAQPPAAPGPQAQLPGPQTQPPAPTEGGPPPAPGQQQQPTVPEPKPVEPIELPAIGAEPAIDPTVIKGLMKQGFNREQAEEFARKSTVTPMHGAPRAQPVAPRAELVQPSTEEAQHAQIREHIRSGKSPGEAQSIVTGGEQQQPPQMIEYSAQPNAYTKGRGDNHIQNIILHSSDGTEKGDVNQLTQHLSAHYYVTRDGRIYHFVNDNDSAWHAGKTINDKSYGNSATLGIEQEHVDGKQDWPEAQVRASARLTSYLQNKYGLGNNNVLKHSDIAPERKVDPVDYPWDNFYKYVAESGGGVGKGIAAHGGGAVLPRSTAELNVTRFGYRSDPNLDPESAKGHGKYVQNMIAGYDVALNKAGAAKVGNPKPGEKFTYEGKEYRYGDKVPEKYADARFDVYDPNFGGGETKTAAGYMPAGGGGGAVGGGPAGVGGGYGVVTTPGATTPETQAGITPTPTGGGAAEAAAAVSPQQQVTAPKGWPTSGGAGYRTEAPEENVYSPYAGYGGGGYGGGGRGGAAFMPGGVGRRYGGIEPEEEAGAPPSTIGVPNPGGSLVRQHLATNNLKEAIAQHTDTLSPDDTRVRKQDDNLFKGEHFQAGDELHTHVLSNVPDHEKQVLSQAQNAIQNRQPMHVSYASAPKEGLEQAPTTKSRQIEYQMSSPQARMLKTTKAQIAGHSFIPTSIGVSLAKKQGDPHEGYIQGVSTNAAANNWHHLNGELTAMGQKTPYPKLGHKFYNDLEGYVSNLNAGFRGTGEGPAPGTEEYPSQPDPRHHPYQMNRHEADFMNAVINNQAAKAKGASGLRELARKGGTLLTEEGETNPIRHAIDLRQAGIRQKLAQHPQNIANPVVQKAAQRLWSQDTLEPTIRSFKAGLVHSIHEHPGQMPEAIRPGQEFKEITESLGRQAIHGRPDVPMAASFMPAGGYVSPNIEEGTGISGALKQLYSRAHRTARDFYQRVEDGSRVGGKHGGQVVPTVGNWQGTAEGSALIHDPDDALPEMRLKNAIRGLYSGQKGTASFDFHKGGEDRLYDIDFPQANHTQVDKLVSQHKFPANTIYKGPDGTLRAHIIDPGGENRDAAIQLARAAGAKAPEYHVGTAAFDGGDTREEAANAYRRILGEGGIQTREGQRRGGYGGQPPGGEHPLQAHYEEAEDNYQRLARERGWEKPEEESEAPPFAQQPTPEPAAAAFMPAGGKAAAKLEKPKWETADEPTRQKYLKKRVKQILANQSTDESAIPLKALKNDDGSYRYDPQGNPTFDQPGYNIVNSPFLKKKGLDQLGLSPKANEQEDTVDPEQHGHLNFVERRRLSALRNASAVETMGNKILESYNSIKDVPEIAAGKGWYSSMRDKLSKAFGPDNEIFAQLLGATSAKTPVRSNFIQALDAYEQYKRGNFDRHAQKYLEAHDKMEEGDGALTKHMRNLGILGADEPDHETEGDAIAHWIDHHNILPKQQTGAKYNANSNAVLKVLAGTWLKEADAPKTPNFAGNLTGRTKEATIDVWAARHIKRLGHEGLTGGKPWRDQAKGEAGVSGLDFAFSQDAMRHAADKIGINPDDLQAILWYAEKHHYQKQGWTRGEGAKKSSFDDVFDKVFAKSGEPMSSEELRNHYAEEAKTARKLAGKVKTARGYHAAGSPKLAPYMEKHGLTQEHLGAPEEEEEEAAA